MLTRTERTEFTGAMKALEATSARATTIFLNMLMVATAR
jgi:hypothetical protein